MKDLSNDELRLIQAVYTTYEPTRTLLSRKIGLSIIKTSNLLDALETKRFIEKNGKVQAKSGRPSFIYNIMPERFLSIGVALKKTSIHIIAINGRKDIVKEVIIDYVPPEDQEKQIPFMVDEICGHVRSVIQELAEKPETTVSLGLSLPGMVDSEKGIWLLGLQIGGIRHINVVDLLTKKLSIPVIIEDNARALTYLEKIIGLGVGKSNFVLLYLGSGVGTGIVINDTLYRGIHGIAGEIGHIVHEENSYRCSCGNVGCLETVLTPWGIVRVFDDRLNEGVVSTLRDGQQKGLTLQAIVEAARQNDRLAVKTLFETGNFLGDACSMLIGILNPPTLIISGEASILKPFIEDSMMQTVNQKLLPEMMRDLNIVFSDYNPNHESLGAALMAMERNWEGIISRRNQVD